MKWQYTIMHIDDAVASIDNEGLCHIMMPDFLPFNLYLEEGTDISSRIENLINFYYWCASRLLTLDRKYAKEILNAIGAGQGTTDRERARISLTYHCVTLTDVFWVKSADYLVGNTDRHWGNWGFLIDNRTNRPIRLHPLMDFNKSFLAYDTTDGAGCLTADTHMSQKEAAVLAVKAVGLNQKADVLEKWFPDPAVWEMFSQRLEVLKCAAR